MERPPSERHLDICLQGKVSADADQPGSLACPDWELPELTSRKHNNTEDKWNGKDWEIPGRQVGRKEWPGGIAQTISTCPVGGFGSADNAEGKHDQQLLVSYETMREIRQCKQNNRLPRSRWQ